MAVPYDPDQTPAERSAGLGGVAVQCDPGQIAREERRGIWPRGSSMRPGPNRVRGETRDLAAWQFNATRTGARANRHAGFGRRGNSMRPGPERVRRETRESGGVAVQCDPEPERMRTETRDRAESQFNATRTSRARVTPASRRVRPERPRSGMPTIRRVTPSSAEHGVAPDRRALGLVALPRGGYRLRRSRRGPLPCEVALPRPPAGERQTLDGRGTCHAITPPNLIR